MLHFCHITNQSGQLFPVRELSLMARARGIITIVDGAHAMGHFPYKLRDLEMDYYGVSLHKWLLAPLGTGLLYVRRDRIASTWPLQAAPERTRQRHPQVRGDRHASAAARAAINEAVAFQQAIGIERKAARLRYLTMRWANELKKEPRVTAALQPRARTDMGAGGRLDRRRGLQQAGHPPLGQAPHRHRRRRAREPEGAEA